MSDTSRIRFAMGLTGSISLTVRCRTEGWYWSTFLWTVPRSREISFPVFFAISSSFKVSGPFCMVLMIISLIGFLLILSALL